MVIILDPSSSEGKPQLDLIQAYTLKVPFLECDTQAKHVNTKFEGNREGSVIDMNSGRQDR